MEQPVETYLVEALDGATSLNVSYRKERRYTVPALSLIRALAENHFGPPVSYRVQTIYLDKNFRVRMYPDSGDIFLENKVRLKDSILKVRSPIRSVPPGDFPTIEYVREVYELGGQRVTIDRDLASGGLLADFFLVETKGAEAPASLLEQLQPYRNDDFSKRRWAKAQLPQPEEAPTP